MSHFLLLLATLWFAACKQHPQLPNDAIPKVDTLPIGGLEGRVRTGAEVLVTDRIAQLTHKRIAIVANNTSLVFAQNDSGGGAIHLVDTLYNRGIKIAKVFAPEHGFRGDQDAGKHVSNSKDLRTGIPIVSLFGNSKKPKPEQLSGIDMVIFDIQDVGARFYTYISTMSYVMEACAEQKIPVMILDRPNPNGWYVEGPVMENGFKSFVGMHNVPTAHGMTIGEYALMVNGEGWLAGGKKCILDVVKCEGYDHNQRWIDTGLPWVAPSPNLTTEYSAYLYPMLCWFEGIKVSVGRGTSMPFEVLGAPWHKGYHNEVRRDSMAAVKSPTHIVLQGLEGEYVEFTPKAMPGKAANPDFKDYPCYGIHFLNRVSGKQLFMAGIALLKNFEDESKTVGNNATLYQPSFNLLMGNNTMRNQLKTDQSIEAIYESWQAPLGRFKVMRKKYLLYPDFD